MAPSTYLASAIVMGILFVGVVAVLSNGQSRRSDRARREASGGLSRLVHDGRAWQLGFVLLSLAVIGVTVTTLSGGGSGAVFLGAGGLFAAFLAAGVYVAAKSHGHPHSHAVGEAVVALGALGLVVVVVQLIATSGA